MKQELVDLMPRIAKDLRDYDYEQLTNNGLFEYLGSGISRTTIRIRTHPETVFKFSRYDDNQRELAFYGRLAEEDKKYFAEPKSLVQIDKITQVLEMEYVPGQQPDDSLYREFPELYDHLNKKYGVYDLHAGNYRVINGQPKIFDYGHH